MSKGHAEIFKILGVESRIKILELLKRKGPLGVNELADELGISPSAVSQHLKILKFAGLVKSQRKGYWMPYEVNLDALDDCRIIAMQVCSCCCSESGKHSHTKSKSDDTSHEIAMLKEYENDLRKELKRVRERIAKLKGK